MITIKNNTYTRGDKDALAKVLLSAKNELTNTFCVKHEDTCETCPYRHVCYDLDKAFVYAVKELRCSE